MEKIILHSSCQLSDHSWIPHLRLPSQDTKQLCIRTSFQFCIQHHPAALHHPETEITVYGQISFSLSHHNQIITRGEIWKLFRIQPKNWKKPSKNRRYVLFLFHCYKHLFIFMCFYISQLRPCPHLEQDVLSDCLSMQQLQSSTSSQHLYNGKDGRSPALGPDIFTGAHKMLAKHPSPWQCNVFPSWRP